MNQLLGWICDDFCEQYHYVFENGTNLNVPKIQHQLIWVLAILEDQIPTKRWLSYHPRTGGYVNRWEQPLKLGQASVPSARVEYLDLNEGRWVGKNCVLGLPPTQDASHHQDYYIFSRESL